MTITDYILREANMTEAELKTELAVLLYQKQKLSIGLAARLADMDRIHFQLLLGSRQVSINYDEAAFEEDLQTIDRLKPPLRMVVVSERVCFEQWPTP